jgi:hypothetical protein
MSLVSPSANGTFPPAGLHLLFDRIIGRGNADDDHFLHCRMRADHFLDLEEREVLAAPADAILVAVDEVEEAVLAPAHHVAGMETEIAPGGHGLLRSAVIAGHYRERRLVADDEFARLAHGNLHIRFRIDQPAIEPFRRHLAATGRAVVRVQRMVERAIHLRRSIEFYELHAEPLAEYRAEFRRDRHHGSDPQRIARIVVARLLRQDEIGHRSENVRRRCAGVADIGEPAAGTEAPGDGDPRSRDQRAADAE